MAEIKKRSVGIDYAKGFAILLLIISHCIIGEGVFKTWIFSFHMPIFFIVSGILKSRKNKRQTIKVYLYKRIKQLLVPYLIWGLVLIAFYQVLSFISRSEFTFYSQLFNLITLQGIDSLWFIPCYMVAELIFMHVYLKMPKYWQYIGIICGIGLLSFINYMNISFNWIGQLGCKILIGLILICIGYTIEEKVSIKTIPIYCSVIGLIIFSILAEINGFVGISALKLQNTLLFFINAIGLSISIIAICEYFVQKNNASQFELLKCFGENTIVVVCTNNLIIECVRLLDYKLFGNFLVNKGIVGSIIFSIMMIIIEYTLINISKSRFSILFGK